MSENAEFSVWSNDEADLLEYIDKDIKLVSSGSESESQQIQQSNGEVWKVLQKNETVNKNVQSRQSDLEKTQLEELLNQNSNIIVDKLKSHFSSNDLSKLPGESQLQCETVPNNVIQFSHSHSCNSLSNNERNAQNQKYDHAQNKIKQYHNVMSSSEERNIMNKGEDYVVEVSKDYLEEVNKRLMMELEEKDALLTKLQENYENLLLKYAEAQNKIDQLRLKSVCESTDCQTHSVLKQNLSRTNLQLPINIFSKEHQETWEDGKCQKAVVAPFMKDNYQEKPEGRKVDRPTSLPLEPKVVEREAIKAAGTPTDSEGVSSVITSMSGHSKILNTLDVHSPNRDSKLVNYPERDFILNDSSVVNDAFDKVKNWQNSLPPLELIETPETTLYDESPVHGPPSTNYLMPPSPKDIDEEDEVAFPSPREPQQYEDVTEYRRITPRKKSQLPVKHPKRTLIADQTEPGSHQPEDVPSGCIIQRRRKKPPLLRCSSLPTYDYDTPRSAARNLYIPPLDLENLTLSDVDSSQVEYDDYGKDTRGTSSYVTSQSGSIEFSSQTYRTLNQSFKGRLSEYTNSPYSKPCFNKSTSISPERCNDLPPAPKLKPDGTCHVCGEKLQPVQSFPCRSNSYQSFTEVKDPVTTPKSSSRKHPFNRSVSFNSETNSHRRCFHSHGQQRSSDSLETFDAYANNLKARSQVIMKALAAHVNNT